jgi:hypothetical protein
MQVFQGSEPERSGSSYDGEKDRSIVDRWASPLCGAGVSACTVARRPIVAHPSEVIMRLASPYAPVELQVAREEFGSARLAKVRAKTESAWHAARELCLSVETLRAAAMRLAALYNLVVVQRTQRRGRARCGKK